MSELMLTNEPAIRLGFFLFAILCIALAESIFPRRRIAISRWVRWSANLGISVLNTVLLRAVFPLAAVGVAVWAESQGFGLLNMVTLPSWLSIVMAVLLLDLAIYFQHRMFHVIPLFWRFHRMHHSDQEFDVTTGVRFHPIEIVLSMVIKLAVVLLLGPAALAVLLFEIILNASALFNHGNIRIGGRVDRWLRRVVVTPDMHRVHHSIIARETNSNFGFSFPWWDRLFRTYVDQPTDDHALMAIGLDEFRDGRQQRLLPMLLQPFK